MIWAKVTGTDAQKDYQQTASKSIDTTNTKTLKEWKEGIEKDVERLNKRLDRRYEELEKKLDTKGKNIIETVDKQVTDAKALWYLLAGAVVIVFITTCVSILIAFQANVTDKLNRSEDIQTTANQLLEMDNRIDSFLEKQYQK